jgi:hypothetical protein
MAVRMKIGGLGDRSFKFSVDSHFVQLSNASPLTRKDRKLTPWKEKESL